MAEQEAEAEKQAEYAREAQQVEARARGEERKKRRREKKHRADQERLQAAYDVAMTRALQAVGEGGQFRRARSGLVMAADGMGPEMADSILYQPSYLGDLYDKNLLPSGFQLTYVHELLRRCPRKAEVVENLKAWLAGEITVALCVGAQLHAHELHAMGFPLTTADALSKWATARLQAAIQEVDGAAKSGDRNGGGRPSTDDAESDAFEDQFRKARGE